MKSKALLCLLFIVGNLIYAQNLSKDEAFDLIVNDICKVLNEDNKTFDKSKSLEKKQFELGLLIIKTINIRKKESKELTEYISGIGFEKIGEEIGMKMNDKCGDALMDAFSTDELLDMVDKKYGNDNENIDIGELKFEGDVLSPPPAPKNESDLSIVAELISIHNDAVSYLKFNDDFEKEHVFLIVNQFEGKELLNKNDYGKQFKVYYSIEDYYDLSESRYIKKKVVKYIELLD